MKQFCFNKGDDFLLDNNDIIIKLKNSIYGLAIGDALGVPVEFKLRNTMDKKPVNEMRGFGTYLQPRGTWSDDTSMTLATLDALSQSKYDIRLPHIVSKRKNLYLFLQTKTRNAYIKVDVPDPHSSNEDEP